MIKVYDATKLKKRKKNAIFLGTGKSINDIDKKSYMKLKQNFDIWAVNNFYIHNFIIPDFLHFEIKADLNGEIFTRLLNQKQKEYKDVIFIADIATRERDYPYKFLDLTVFKNFYSYNRSDRLLSNGNYNMSGEYIPDPSHVQITFGKSNSKILDIMCRMKYEKIYFSGVDLNSCEYFWTNNEEYNHVGIPDNLKWCGKGRTLGGKPAEYKMKDNHPVHNLAPFFSEFLKFNNIKAYNLSQESELKNHMETIDISDMFFSE